MEAYKHQQTEYDAHRWQKARALLWQQRTGKTKAAIDFACNLYQACEIDAVIVVAPNGVHRNWTLKQLPLHMWPEIYYYPFAWCLARPKNDTLFEIFLTAQPAWLPWFAINMESLHFDATKAAIKRFIRAHPNFLLIVDESHHFAQPSSKRTKVVWGLAREAAYVRILTGTLLEDSPLQAYAQFKIINCCVHKSSKGCGALGHADYDAFKSRYAVYEPARYGGYDVLREYQNLPELRGRIAEFASVVLRADCADLPPIQQDVRLVELGPAARGLYQRLKRLDMQTLTELGFQEPPSGAALLTKLQQIEGGAIITPRGVRTLDENGKFEALFDEALGCRFIVFCEFVHEVERYARQLNALGLKVGMIHGQVKNREQTLRDFQEKRLNGLVAQSGAAAEGYDLSAADKLIWASQTPVARKRAQANERATAIGTTSKQVIDLVVPNGVDEYYLQLTTTKTELADDLSRRGLKKILECLDV